MKHVQTSFESPWRLYVNAENQQSIVELSYSPINFKRGFCANLHQRHTACGQSYKAPMLVNYASRVVEKIATDIFFPSTHKNIITSYFFSMVSLYF